MNLDGFSQGDSPLHHLDPRMKIVAYLPLAVLTALIDSFFQVLLALTAALILAGTARIFSRLLLQRLAVVNMFMAFLWLTLPYSVSGEPLLWQAGALSPSIEGTALSLLLTLKTNAIALYTVSLPGTSTVMSLSHAMLHLRFPRKLVTIFYFFYRYTGVISREFSTMQRMLKARAFHATSNLHTVRVYGYFTGILFIRSIERAERVYHALVMRNFTGEFPLLFHFNARGNDIAFLCLMAVVILTIAFL